MKESKNSRVSKEEVEVPKSVREQIQALFGFTVDLKEILLLNTNVVFIIKRDGVTTTAHLLCYIFHGPLVSTLHFRQICT